jgi:hypothetical protein
MGGGLAAALVDEMQRLDIAVDDKPKTLSGSLPHGGDSARRATPFVAASPTWPSKREARAQ